VGTLYPSPLEALTGYTISVGAPFFDITFGAVMAPLLVVLPFGPVLAWKRGDFVAVAQRLAGAAVRRYSSATSRLRAVGGVDFARAARAAARLLGSVRALAELVDRAKFFRTDVMTSLAARSACRGRPRRRHWRISAWA